MRNSASLYYCHHSCFSQLFVGDNKRHEGGILAILFVYGLFTVHCEFLDLEIRADGKLKIIYAKKQKCFVIASEVQ